MKIIYDSTYAGFLNALSKSLEEGHEEISAFESEGLFETNFLISSDLKAAEAFENKIEKISPQALKVIRLLWLSESKGFENLALGYIKNLFKYGAEGLNNIQNIYVAKSDRIAKKVLSEVHRFKGFVRFSQTAGGLMFAEIEPQHNILPLIKGHFRTRFGKMPFLIYDKKRKLSLVNIEGKCEIKNIEPDFEASFENDAEIEKLWLKFFQTIAIESRKNEKLQKSFVPLKYRRNMTEFRIK